MKPRFIHLFLLCFSLYLTQFAVAKKLTFEETPEPLKPWVNWVLKGQENQACSRIYNKKRFICSWASKLTLNLTNKGGEFTQTWETDKSNWLFLAGSAKNWPLQVKVNDQPAIVSFHRGTPAIYLPQGHYQISGQFQWDRLPESLTIPKRMGFVSLLLEGKSIAFPKINGNKLWLEQTKQLKTIQDSLDIQVFRHIKDDQPMQIETRLELNVAGQSREVQLSPVLLDGFIPLKIKSKLPARINKNGILRVQVRPGRWTIYLTARGIGEQHQLTLPTTKAPLPQQEVWVFQAVSHLRLVEIVGINSIDPRQTSLPQEWQQYPAYRMQVGQTLELKTLQRGSAEPEPNRLNLNREMWLDFDGKGYTFRDQISGTMTKGWRLETSDTLDLGLVSIHNQPQFITRLDDKGHAGVEVRRGSIDLSADSRYQKQIETPPITGWQGQFQKVKTRLYLPSGWRLFFAQGMDNNPATWIGRWTLLDLFLVLISAIAIARLWGWHWGIFSLITLALIWHEPHAPKLIWLNLIMAIALLKLIPKGLFQRLLIGYRNLSFIVLLLIVLPFAVQQVRYALYPQLARYQSHSTDVQSSWVDNEFLEMDAMEEPVIAAGKAGHFNQNKAASLPQRRQINIDDLISDESFSLSAPEPEPKKAYYRRKIKVLNQIDPNANIQTGPGLPSWKTKATVFSWNGTVNTDQKMRLFYLSPQMNLILNFVGVFLLLILMGRLAMPMVRQFSLNQYAKASSILLCLGLIPFLIQPQAVQAKVAPFPDQPLLNELKKRLTEAPKCLPSCAQISTMKLQLKTDHLQIQLNIHSATKTAIPLPGGLKYWQPQEIILNDKPLDKITRDSKGVIWISLPTGIHQVIMRGALPQRQQIHLPLPLKPHYVEWQGADWSIEGIRKNKIPEKQLQLVRKKILSNKKGTKKLTDESSILPPLLRISRTLHLGLEWTLETKVIRLSPLGSPINTKIPLLTDESVLSNQYKVKDGILNASFGAFERQIQWQSQLKIKPEIKLTAVDGINFVEEWKVDISPNWHVELSGIPTIHQNQDNQEWLPQWQPWANESVTLAISKPKGIKGQTLTIDSTKRTLKVGKRGQTSTLKLTLRSSQGAQHPIQLPQNSELLFVKINQQNQPVRQQGRIVNIPIKPGKQTIEIQWREIKPLTLKLTSSLISVGSANVNHQTTIKMPKDRWVLFVGGPRQGPAVLFWGVLIVILITAIALGYSKLTPLKHFEWFLLGMGLCLASPLMVLIIVGWLLILGQRPRLAMAKQRWVFNLAQISLAVLTLIALATLLVALQKGLLGYPDMQIAGNGSTQWVLKWFQDRSFSVLPNPWVISVPLLGYRLFMLCWALWLAFALLNWLKWGWQNFSQGGLWRSKEIPEELID